MPLYLTGGGEQEDFKQLDRRFIQDLPHDAPILVVPLAMEEDEYEDALERAEDCFPHKKIHDIVLCEDVNQIPLDELLSYSAVFIEGGNTFKLIQAVRQSQFFQNLEQFLQQGKAIYADSAGAIVLGDNVKTAFLGEDADEDEAKLQDYRGLGLIGQWSVHCHYEADEAEDLQNLLYEVGTPILALAEPVGVFIDGSHLEVFGKDSLEIFTFTGRKDHTPGSAVDLDQALS